MATTTPLDSSLRLYSLRDLTAAGYGSRAHLLGLIHSGELPAVMIGNAWKIRELELAAYAGVEVGDLQDRRATDSAAKADEMSDLAAVVSRVVSTWPRFTAERRAELSRLLSD